MRNLVLAGVPAPALAIAALATAEPTDQPRVVAFVLEWSAARTSPAELHALVREPDELAITLDEVLA